MTPTRLRLGAGRLTVPFLAITITAASLLASSFVRGEPSILERERERRASQAIEARQELERGDKAYEVGNYQEAVAAYAKARGLLGANGVTSELWKAAGDRYAQASVERAKQLAKTGSRKEAHALLDTVLAKDLSPGHAGALQLREQIDDPIRYNPGLTPEHVADVDKVRRLLYEAQGFADLGRYGQALAFYEDVIRIDPYNTAARRGMEELSRLKSEYYASAKDQARAEMLTEVAGAWEIPPIPVDDYVYGEEGFGRTEAVRSMEEKLRTIVVPSVELDDVTLQEAVEFLRQMSIMHDEGELDEKRKGISFVVDMGTGESEVAQKILRVRINLKLSNVPLGKVLDFIAEATSTKVRIDEHAVIILPRGAVSDAMTTRTFRVPADILSRRALGGAGDGGGDDPFADDEPAGGLLPVRLSAKEYLQEQGVSFPEGSSASLNRGILRVTNTRTNLDYVEQVVMAIAEKEPVVVVIDAKIINVRQETLEELGYDWVITGGKVGGGWLFDGGTPGNGTQITDFGFEGGNALTSGLRSGTDTSIPDSIDALIEQGIGRVGSSVENVGSVRAPGILSLVGVWDSGTVGVMMRGLDQNTANDEMFKKTVVTRSGQKAQIESVREMIVPTEYEPPELPNSFGSAIGIVIGPDGEIIEQVTSSLAFATPATPTAFETVKIGCLLEVEPVVGPNRQLIELAIQPTVRRFDGFIDYGTPINGGNFDFAFNPDFDPLDPDSPVFIQGGSSGQVTQNSILMPVFSLIQANSSLTIADGHTVVMGGLLEDKHVKFEDKVPILGDLPFLGQFFRSESETSQRNAMVIMVTVNLLDPSGRPYRDR